MPDEGPWIALVTCGPVASDILERLGTELAAIFGRPVRPVGTALPLEGFDPDRGQYRGEAVLEVARDSAPGAARVLALTEADVYAGEMNFIFGEAELGGRAALVSLFRLRPEHNRRHPEREQLLRRALVECVHELGHTFGLRHCPISTCVMHFSEEVAATDQKGPGFCPVHARRLAEAVAAASKPEGV